MSSECNGSRVADVRAIRREYHTRVLLLYELHHLAQAIKEDNHSGIEATIVQQSSESHVTSSIELVNGLIGYSFHF